jgi:hypothetical protein
MATWTNIPGSNLDPGAPARSLDAKALRDNPIAIAEGASGAPRIQTGAIENSAVTNGKLLPPAAGSDFVIYELLGNTYRQTLESDYVPTGVHDYDSTRNMSVVCLVAGSIRCVFDQRMSSDSPNPASQFARVRILKNGSVVAQFDRSVFSSATRTHDETVDVGDRITFQMVMFGSQLGRNAQWRNVKILSANKNLAVCR